VVAHSVNVKRAIVRDDPYERGRRALLNAGHTIGHALETSLGHGVLRHGEAVAIGLLAEARWAARGGELPARLARLISELGLPTRVPTRGLEREVLRARLLAALGVDKKRERGTLRLAAPFAPGVVRLEHVRDPMTLVDCLEEFP